MATITNLSFAVKPGDTINTLNLEVDTTLRFNEFDRNTNLNYRLTYSLVGVAGTVAAIVGGATPAQVEIDPDTELAVFPSVVVEASDATNSVLKRADVFEIDRSVADEDPPEMTPDELQIHCQLDPALPATATFISETVKVTL